MPRLPRVYINNSLYYITCKTLPSQKIFKDKEDYSMYFGLLKKYKDEVGVKLYAYTLMPSHLHLLCEVDDKTSISTIMHNLNSSYTKYFNGKYSRKGHLFRERFRMAIIEKNPQLLLNLTAHIHLNTNRLNMELTANSHPYNSYGLYLDYEQHNDYDLGLKEDIAEIISGLVGENYSDFMKRITARDEFKKLHKKLQHKKIVGSDAFIARVKKEIQLQKLENEKESESKVLESKRSLLLNAGTIILAVVLSLSGIYIYYNYSRQDIAIKNEIVKIEKLTDLEQTEWQTQIFSSDRVLVSNDVISFKDGKFSSAYLTQFAYPHINYSIAHEGDKIIWETMQTSPQGTASWRGEVLNDQMKGVLSLQQQGKQPRDFYFKSLKFWRR